MKQLTQKLKDGKVQIIEVPQPLMQSGCVLVRNYFSLISVGTEGSTVKAARESLVGKAKARPQQIRQVIDVLKSQGPIQTYRVVNKKLDSYSPLGYSSAGVVIDVAADVKEFQVGDSVACAGAGYASHAEIVSVPKNLCLKLPDNADLKKAAYNTLGAIALQGVRQADLRLGETCAVIGLGLIGQLTCLMIRASGIKVVGIDIDAQIIETAKRHCTDTAFRQDEQDIQEKIAEFTDGIGVDAIIITAATKSLDPVNFAGSIARKKGKVVIVGNVPTGFDRENYYKKELELKMSCSYGPGRYDLNYEKKGIDYPAGYVRWTENRNMQAFQELVQKGKIDIDYLTTHTFKLDDAPSAYNMILKKEDPYLGILIRYDVTKKIESKKVIIRQKAKGEGLKEVSIGFIGAGSYAQSYLLPNIPKNKDIVFKGVMNSSGTASKTVAEKYGFEFCTSDEKDIFGNNEINTVFIATRHNTHAEYVIKSFIAGKHVFVEKPLCLTEAELNKIKEVYEQQAMSNEPRALLVGFNRRFAPLTKILVDKLGTGPMSMIYRINAGSIPADSWIQDNDIGGGRIIGEVCHFVDFLSFLNGSQPERVFASALPEPEDKQDTVNINLTFRNGSIGTISYFANGPKSLSKEYIEIYRSGTTAVLKDFKELEMYTNKTFKKKLLSQDKGQKEMVRSFIKSVKAGDLSPISFEEIYSATFTTFKILESIKTRAALRI
jgi:predicted dehydrogenase